MTALFEEVDELLKRVVVVIVAKISEFFGSFFRFLSSKNNLRQETLVSPVGKSLMSQLKLRKNHMTTMKKEMSVVNVMSPSQRNFCSSIGLLTLSIVCGQAGVTTMFFVLYE